jgi:hypothetical protein
MTDSRFLHRAALSLLPLLLLLASASASAGGPRAFPGDSVQVKLHALANGMMLVDDGVTLQVSNSVRIYNEENRTVTRGRLPTEVTVRLLLDRAAQVQRIWILAADEIDANPDNKQLTRQRERAGAGVKASTTTNAANATNATATSSNAP